MPLPTVTEPAILRPDLLEFTSEDLEQFCIQKLGARPGRGKMVAAWLFRRGVTDFDAMVDINKPLLGELKRQTRISSLEICDKQIAADGTHKLLYRLEDGCTVEGVIIPGKRGRQTLCISTQVGCGIGCAFCFTATGGFTRNLRAGEMIGQIFAAQGFSGIPLTNIVLMGQGEPLSNFDAVKRFIDIATDTNGLAFPPRKITVSTSGLVPVMDRLAEETRVSLALSLNATTDEVRDRLIPLNRVYPIRDLIAAVERFCRHGKRRVLIEYVLLKGVNDSLEDARRLLDLVRNLPCMVNLLPFNEFEGSGFERPDPASVNEFWRVLQGAGVTTIVRDGRGDDIRAACGQLKGRPVEEAKPDQTQ